MNGTTGFTLYGAAGTSSGWSVASAGDVNGDGFADVIVGDGPFNGSTYVVFGHAPGFAATLDLSTLNGTNGFKLTNETAGDGIGRSVASAGDVNGDGFDDVIVGAVLADPHGSDSGASYVVFGKATGFAANIQLSSLDGSNGFKLSGVTANDHSGYSVASAGDVNGDGYDDVIIGATGADPNGSFSGTSYVVFGKAGGFAANLDLSSLNGSNGFRLNGSDGDLSGRSVASAGDVNGDGFGDLIVGAYGAEPNGQNSGETYVVFGKAGGFAADLNLSDLDGITGFKMRGGAAGDQSGRSVASAGDVNGDGFADLIIGANYADPNGMDSGASYVVFGHASTFAATLDLSTLDGITGFRLSGAETYDSSGFSVASAGDFNGDGFDDLIIGASAAQPNGYGSGASYVVFGRASGFGTNIDLSTLSGSNGFRLPGGAAYDFSGQSVASAGDVNGDGYDDLIVGAKGADANGVNSGASYIVFGGAFGESTTPVIMTGTNAAEIFIGGRGNDVLAGGGGADVFHGGAGDDTLVVSDFDFQLVDGGGGTDTLEFGGMGLTLDLTDPAMQAKIQGTEIITLANYSGNTVVVDQASILGDGFDTGGGKHVLTVRGGGYYSYGAVVFRDIGWEQTSPGVYVSGNAEVHVGSYIHNVSTTSEMNLSGLNGRTGFTLSGAAAGDMSGWSVASAGDVNGDGFADMIVGSPNADPHGSDSGASYVVFGKESGFAANIDLGTLNGITGFKLSGSAASDMSGFSVASAGDVNGDGYGDLIVGARNADPHGVDSGAAYVVFGQASAFAANIDLSTLNGTTGFKLSGTAAGDTAGFSVASAGDLNGDGFADLIVTAANADTAGGANAGTTYVVFGKAGSFASNLDLSTLDGTTGFRLDGAEANEQRGFSVSSAGDFNGDGYDDLIVGAPGAGGEAGSSYVVFGKASGFGATIDLSTLDGTTGFKLNAGTIGERAGASVAAAGDVNGDGFDDLIIGAPSAYQNYESNNGASYVVFGTAASFGANRDLYLTGNNGFLLIGAATDARSGFSVASAGDFNGDGYDDLIVGAPGTGGAPATTYVVFGGNSSGFVVDLNTPDRVFHLISDGGQSVASAGDVNGDGYDDLIVGAPTADSNGTASGASYVVFGGAFGATVTTAGTAAAERLNGSAGNDVLSGGGGADVFHGGAGNDRLTVGDLAFRVADGGGGSDTLALGGAGQTLDLRDPMTAARLENIERIDLTGTGGNTLRIDQAAVLGGVGAVSGAAHVLAVEGNVGDTLHLADMNWTKSGSFTDANGTFDRYVLGNAEVDVEQGVTVVQPTLEVSGLGGSTGFTLNGVAAGDNSGYSVASAGDLNGDGFDDLVIGAWGADSHDADSGASYVLFGKSSGFGSNVDLSSLNGSTGFKLSGVAAGDMAGWSVASAGDANGDGIDDLFIGARGADPHGADSGAAYVVFGKTSGFDANLDLSTLNGTTGFKMSGRAAGDGTGWSVASAGDFNGDGIDDMVVGSPYSREEFGPNAGTTYVVFGKASGFAANLDLSTLDGTTGFRIDAFSGMKAGTSVTTMGDLNGDGFDDLLIGVKGLSQIGSSEFGGFYVMFGRPGDVAPSTPISLILGLRWDGATAGDFTGASVAAAGDVNGDGYDDMIVGAFGADPHGSQSGATYIVFGKGTDFAYYDFDANWTHPDGSTGFRLDGLAAGDRNGLSVSSAGDFNGDGYADLLVGAPGSAGTPGTTYVVFGRASFDAAFDLSTADATSFLMLQGVAAGDQSGRSVASAGDINGDGYDDLIVGAPTADSNGADSGSSYVVFGGAFGAVVTTTGTSAAEMLIGSAGNDLLIGGGGADVFHGGAGNDRLAVGSVGFRVADGGGGTDTLALDGAGLTLDIRDPLSATRLEGIERIDLTGTGNNMLRVDQDSVLGGIGTTIIGGKHVLAVEGNAGDVVRLDNWQWTNTGSFTDTNGTFDRYAFGNAEVDVEQGVTVVVPSDTTVIRLLSIDGTNGFTIQGDSGYDRSGRSVASAGDVNGDGFDDLLVGAWTENTLAGNDSGAAYIVYGTAGGFPALFDITDIDSTTGVRLSGATRYDGAGWSVASAGDVNADGFADVIVGTGYAGLSYVVFGAASLGTGAPGLNGANVELSGLDGTNGFKMSAGGRAGFSVASAGDINGDGFDDVVVGAFGGIVIPGAPAGASYVVYGKASGFAASIDLSTLNGSNGFKLGGVAGTGWSVASAGDVNGDGVDDLFVGAKFESSNGYQNGAGYVVFGSTAGFPTSFDVRTLNGSDGFKLIGSRAGSFAGTSVASAGDINGDGFGDVIIGAYGSGAAYVVYGKASGFAASIELSSLNGVNGFKFSGGGSAGSVVASAGDFNGDGFDDLIVTAPGTESSGNGTGSTYVVFGKASGFEAVVNLDLLPGDAGLRFDGIRAQGTTYGNGTVNWAASAGDVNGDGFDDLIIGSSDAVYKTGESYVIFGHALGTVVTTVGTTAAEVLIGGTSDDVLTGGGGADVFHAGAGDDRIVVADLTFRLADGGNDIDTLALSGAGQTLDLANPLVAVRLEGIERIDLTGAGNNTVTINQTAVLGGLGEVIGGKHVLTVEGNAGDKVLFADPQWVKTGSFSDPSGVYDRYEFGNAVVNVEQDVTVPIVVIEGTAGNDVISITTTVPGQPVATYRNDVLNGHGGNDSLDGSLGADLMTGGTGNDIYHVDNIGDVVTELTGEGTDTVRTSLSSYTLGANVERLVFTGSGAFVGTGNALANNLTGAAGNDTLNGGDGNDELNGGTGADAMSGGTGNDTYYVDAIGDVVTEAMGGGNDKVSTTLSSYTLAANVERLVFTGSGGFAGTGNALDNGLTGSAGDDTLVGGGGNDTLNGRTGADAMSGGMGNDIYYVDNVGDVVTELTGEGTDTVSTTLASYALSAEVERLLFTGSGSFVGTGNALANVLTGGAGNDTLNGKAGADDMVGGDGNDIYTVDNAGDVVTELTGEGTDTVQTTLSSYTLGAEVERLLFTGSGHFVGTGNALDNILTGAAGNDALNGGAGNDTLNGKAGADAMAGGAGNDIYTVDHVGDVVTELSGEGIDTVQTTLATYTLSANVERVVFTGSGSFVGTGNALDNGLTGGAGNDTLNGGDGNDTLNGKAGADNMTGGIGSDTYTVDNVGDVVTEGAGGGTDTVQASISYELGANVERLKLQGTSDLDGTGNELANSLTGNTGHNVLDGGLGNDTLNGGGGGDTFRFSTALGSTNVDRILMFDQTLDTIQLDHTIFSALSTGALAAGAFNTGAVATQVDDHILYDQASKALYYDADGAGGVAAVKFATISNLTGTLDHTDFFVV